MFIVLNAGEQKLKGGVGNDKPNRRNKWRKNMNNEIVLLLIGTIFGMSLGWAIRSILDEKKGEKT